MGPLPNGYWVIEIFDLKIFLSYSTKDKKLANKIYRWLLRQAISVWIDRMEMKPGDKLIDKIKAGISSSDDLIVLITKNSNRSRWVRFEIASAMSLEKKDKGPKILPITVNNCKLPKSLDGRYYVKTDGHSYGIDKIISGLFSDKFILELHLSSKSFEVDRLLLVEELGEFYDNPAPIHVWIQNSNLSEKIINIAKKALSGLQHGTFHSPIPYELQNKAIYLDTFLPIYWVNLSILLAKLVESINGRFTKRSDFINIAVESIVNTFLKGIL